MDPDRDSPIPPERAPLRYSRANGLVVLFLLVFTGVGITSVLFHHEAPQVAGRVAGELAGAPSDAEGLVDRWVTAMAPQIHNRIATTRISQAQPWVVTHVVTDPEGGPPEVWGVESEELSVEMTRAEGTRVRVHLPRPHPIARQVLVGDYARLVPRAEPGAEVDADALLRERVERMLDKVARSLVRDVPGASLEILVGDPSDAR